MKLVILMSINVVEANEEIVKDFWVWICGLSKPANPAINNKGSKDVQANYARKTNTQYFYLSFSLDGENERRCTIAPGMIPMIPSLCFIGSEAERPGLTEDELNDFANIDYANIVERHVEIDGKAVEDLDRFRIHTKPFFVTYPHLNIFAAQEGRSMAVADGAYLLLEDFTGEHNIHFKGKIGVPENQNSFEHRTYEQDITYILTPK